MNKTFEFFNHYLDKSTHKLLQNLEEYNRVKDTPGVLMIKATTFYQIYKHLVFTNEGRLGLQDFYKMSALYLYYDKYVCDHGTEFFYYIKLNVNHPLYTIMHRLVQEKIKRNGPEHLDDLRHIVEAVTKYNKVGD